MLLNIEKNVPTWFRKDSELMSSEKEIRKTSLKLMLKYTFASDQDRPSVVQEIEKYLQKKIYRQCLYLK